MNKESETVATVERETTDQHYDEGHDNVMTSNKRKIKRQAYLDDYVSF